MALDTSAARAAYEPLAARFAMSLEEIADSAIRVASSNIVRAIQLISTERGRDPRDYVLVSFGGAGPLHAAQVADELGIDTILVPPNAGVISAYGLLAADYVHHASETRRLTVDAAAAAEVRRVFAAINAREAEGLADLGLRGKLVYGYMLGMRYVGQAYEVPVSFSEDENRQADGGCDDGTLRGRTSPGVQFRRHGRSTGRGGQLPALDLGPLGRPAPPSRKSAAWR